MDFRTFLDRLDRCGGDLDAWPPDERGQAEALMAHSAPARAAFLAMSEVERLLRATSPRRDARPPGVDGLAATATLQRQDRAASRMDRPAKRAVFAAAAVVTLCLGLVLGRGPGRQEDGPDRVLAIAFDTAGAADVD